MRNLLLVQPPQRGLLDGFATGLIDLANFVSDRLPNCQVSILDLGLAIPTALPELANDALRSLGHGTGLETIVGITTTTASYQSALATARAFKATDPDLVVALGGHHVGPEHDVVIGHHRDTVDLVVRGEGERALLALANGVPLRDVPSITFRDGTRIVVTEQAPLLGQQELDSLNVTYRGMRFASAPGKFGHASYVSARGCPLLCSFCSVSGETIRAKSVNRVIEDLRYLVESHGYRRIAIEDNFFAQNRKRTLELTDSVAVLQGQLVEGFTWDCQTRVESIKSAEVLKSLARAGCDAVYLGVEALIESQLAFLGKTPDPQQYLRCLKNQVLPQLFDTPIECFMNLQIALPGENSQLKGLRLSRLSELGKLAQSRGRKITIFPQLSVIYPGTRHFWSAVQHAQFGPNSRVIFETFTEWEEDQQPVLTFLGENFAHGTGGIPTGILDKNLSCHGHFAVREESVVQIRQELEQIAQLSGITVFKYGTHLAGDVISTTTSA